MPDLAVSVMVILGFLACALLLRVLAGAETRTPVRAARPGLRATRAMMDE